MPSGARGSGASSLTEQLEYQLECGTQPPGTIVGQDIVPRSGPELVVEFKRRLAVFAEALSKQPAPVATLGFPYPDPKKACKFCHKCFRETPNPMKGRKNPFLEYSRAQAADCLVCRNMQNWAGMRDWNKADLERRCKLGEDDLFYEKYLLLWFLWVDRNNNPQAALVKIHSEVPGMLKFEVPNGEGEGGGGWWRLRRLRRMGGGEWLSR